MDTAAFFDVVKQCFPNLCDTYKFAVVAAEVESGYDGATVIMQSEGCRMRVLRERVEVFVDFGPLSTLTSNEFYDMWHLIGYLTKNTHPGGYGRSHSGSLDAQVEWQVRRLADVLRPYCEQICDLFREDVLGQTRQGMAEFLKRVSQEDYGPPLIRQ